MADVIVSSGSMRTLANNVEQLANDYKDIYENQLYDTVVNDVKKAWSGKDAEAVLARLEGFHNDFTNMYSVLEQYAKHLRHAADFYDKKQQYMVDEANKLTKDAKGY
ncbi:MAG: WXG100 family type VII secretion target [Oscillospiraceae bacterium]|nr:WXG100 family type VII secretion target [Oscillospiraceae bacterium]